ncbi:hypothetical protein M011DRAFT_407410 [Sporormia fimetaria CBS 119925]|uniref:DUF2293 domain-containing protein n=1 Tax=Sporormia fimetaria CBS 119925 TaxID=1340428 RepID=A0A6A6V6N3_9PLEO|nr:hypothetical protein M011DRAFT_407410 [Sporormia fimetaria CBS 119925]
MSQKREITVSPGTPMPKGYAFLPKGIQYKTLHCRRLTHEARKPLYVVVDGRNKKVLGIRVPKSIFFQVQTLARETLATRRAATEQRDAALVRQASEELNSQFPKMPKSGKEMVLKHGFRKYSGRVGRTGQLTMAKKVQLAVIAHIRHRHTKYDKLMDKGVERTQARKEVAARIRSMLNEWGLKEGKL